jgi:predicted PurR-regulated permease PerM
MMPARDFAQRTLIVLALTALALFAWHIRDVVLLAFGAVLAALLFDVLSTEACRWTGVPGRWCLPGIALVVLSLIAGFFWMFGVQIGGELEELARALPKATTQTIEWLKGRDWGRVLLSQLQRGDMAENASDGAAAAVVGTFWAAISASGHILIITFGGLYLAAQPQLYVKGALSLFPPAQRPRAAQVGEAVADGLRRWLFGQFLAMLLVGTLTTVGLALIGVPSALALGIIAGVAEFVPIVGPIISMVPALIIALPEGVTTALYVALLYVVVQQVEGYVITPLVQRAVVSVPPVIVLFAIVAFGTALGPLGLLFATPLAAALMIAVQTLQVETPARKRSA